MYNVERCIDLSEWFVRGSEPSEDPTRAACWYLGQIKDHGIFQIEDNRTWEQDWEWDWRLCEIPISIIYPEAFLYRDQGRINSINQAESLPPIIVELISDGKVRLLDGAHRIMAAKDNGKLTILAFVGNPRL